VVAKTRCEVVAIMTSAGGPSAIQTILPLLPRDFPAPIIVLQHMTPGFVGGLVASLNAASPLPVMLAKHRDILQDGTVYFAPDDYHVGVKQNREIVLSNAAAIRGFRPSGTYLFNSLVTAFKDAVACVILTGSVEDGIDGLKSAHRAGAPIVVQDQSSSVVFETPAAVISAGLADHELSLAAIPEALISLCGG
jgi:two-component system chemotaxis response regulator CheB